MPAIFFAAIAFLRPVRSRCTSPRSRCTSSASATQSRLACAISASLSYISTMPRVWRVGRPELTTTLPFSVFLGDRKQEAGLRTWFGAEIGGVGVWAM